MVESSPSCQRQPLSKTTKGMLDESAFVAAPTYLPTYLLRWRILLNLHYRL